LVGPKGFLRHPPLTRNFLPMRSFGPTKRRAYLAYSYEFYGSKTIKDLKGKLRSKGIEPVDPYEIALGTGPEIAELDMELIDSCEIFLLYMPPNWESTEIGMELMYAICVKKSSIGGFTLKNMKKLLDGGGGKFVKW